MTDTRGAFQWIVRLLRANNIPFQITGGLAARSYGSTRPLADIDIDVAEKDIPKIAKLAQDKIIFGPKHFHNKNWDLELMTLKYKGQEIDIGGAMNTKIFHHRTKCWVRIPSVIQKAKLGYLYGMRVPIVRKKELIEYKTILGRIVDRDDVRQIG